MNAYAVLVAPLVLLACSASAPDEASSASLAATAGAACPGNDWTYADSWSGLHGSYARVYAGVAPNDEMSSLTVLDDPTSDLRSSAHYTRTTPATGIELGVLQTLAANPAIGQHLTFDDSFGHLRDMYSGMIARSPITKKITRLCIVKEAGPDGTTVRDRKPFLMVRVGL